MEIGVACATFGLILASLMGGPIAKFLITRHNLKPKKMEPMDVGLPEEKKDSGITHLDFLDAGWGSDVRVVREHLPNTFLNIRLDPVQLVKWSPGEIREIITRLVGESANPERTGVCCINMDEHVTDEQIDAIFDTVTELRKSIG